MNTAWPDDSCQMSTFSEFCTDLTALREAMPHFKDCLSAGTKISSFLGESHINLQTKSNLSSVIGCW